jgi:hypothetical protein
MFEGDFVWINQPTPYRVRVEAIDIAQKRIAASYDGHSIGLKVASACYSTQAAAEAARAKP